MKKTRYQWYDTIVDGGFFICIVALAIGWGFRLFAPDGSQMIGLANWIAGPAFYLGWFVLLFTIAARFMRDEYADRLWRQTAANFALIMIFAPPLLYIMAIMFHSPIAHWFAEGGVAFRAAGTPDDYPAQWNMYSGLVIALSFIALYCPVIFTAIYKFHRWRG